MGITPHLVTVTWVGNDNHSIGFKTTAMGANSALPIFASFYQELNAEPDFNSVTKASFEKSLEKMISDLNCDPEKRDVLIKRVFKRKNKKKRLKAINKKSTS